VTNTAGVASVEAPLGRAEVTMGTTVVEVWVGVDRETVVTITAL
jgi:hypothetical protein